MNPLAVILIGSSFVGTGSSIGPTVQWQGGRAALVTVAQSWSAACIGFQTLGPDNQTWIQVGSGVLSIIANQMTEVALPRGQYRMVVNSSIVNSLYASLVTIPPA